jgi:hypothetical protein
MAGMNGSYELPESTAGYKAVFNAKDDDLRKKMPFSEHISMKIK